MKFRAVHVALIAILAIAILLFTTTSSIVPYSPNSLYTRMYKYEGMANLQQLPMQPPAAQQPPAEQQPEQNVFQKMMGTFQGSFGNGNQKPKAESEKVMVEGFALQPSPLNDSEPIDRYSKATSSPNCFGKSGGYSNSTGPLCLTGDDLKLLSTRGGNVTGTDSTIGH